MPMSFLLDVDVDAIAEVVQTIENTPPDQLIDILRRFVADLLPKIGWALLFFVIGYIVMRTIVWVTRSILKRSRIDATLHSFILSTLRIVLYLLLIVTCLGVMGIPLTPLITAMGAIGLAFSLSVRDSLANVAGGISLLFSRPIGKGDFVDIGSISGTVREIGLVYTQLRTADNKHIYLPNGDVAKATIVNYSREEQRRLDIEFTLRANADIETGRKIIADAVIGCPLALDDPKPIVRVSDQSFATVKISCFCWVKKENMADLKGYLIETVRQRLLQAGLETGPETTAPAAQAESEA